jgi:predicted transcriptional regulator of viral defense system
MTIRDWIKDKEISGITTFSFKDVQTTFPQMALQQIKNELHRLTVQQVVQSIYKSFYVIIPVQYASKGVVPPVYYIDQLMEFLGKPYYISLLSAAEIHGAAHQRPQRFSVTTLRPVVRTSTKKNNLILWNYRNSIEAELLQSKNSETGIIYYSSAELTAVDLVQYETSAGGLSAVATVLAELSEITDFTKNFDAILKICSIAAIQRLGYILENILKEEKQANIIFEQLSKICNKLSYRPLSCRMPTDNYERNNKWKIIINQALEVDEL